MYLKLIVIFGQKDYFYLYFLCFVKFSSYGYTAFYSHIFLVVTKKPLLF